MGFTSFKSSCALNLDRLASLLIGVIPPLCAARRKLLEGQFMAHGLMDFLQQVQ